MGDAAHMLHGADIFLVSQVSSIVDIVVPSKLATAFGAGAMVVASCAENSETARLVRESGGGIVIPAGDDEALSLRREVGASVLLWRLDDRRDLARGRTSRRSLRARSAAWVDVMKVRDLKAKLAEFDDDLDILVHVEGELELECPGCGDMATADLSDLVMCEVDELTLDHSCPDDEGKEHSLVRMWVKDVELVDVEAGAVVRHLTVVPDVDDQHELPTEPMNERPSELPESRAESN